MFQADSANTTDPSAVLPLPTSPRPLAQPIGTGWMPVIYHPERKTEYRISPERKAAGK